MRGQDPAGKNTATPRIPSDTDYFCFEESYPHDAGAWPHGQDDVDLCGILPRCYDDNCEQDVAFLRKPVTFRPLVHRAANAD
jgi:hypothetical protein